VSSARLETNDRPARGLRCPAQFVGHVVARCAAPPIPLLMRAGPTIDGTNDRAGLRER